MGAHKVKRWISFDISRRSTGIVYWTGVEPQATEVVGLDANLPLGGQLLQWSKELDRILAPPPDAITYEDARGVSKIHSEILFGMTGILKMIAYDEAIQMVGFDQTTVKKALTGKGNALKPEMVAAAKARWPELGITTDDEADALGVGLCFINLVGEEQLLK